MKRMKQKILSRDVRRIFEYDRERGQLIWIKSRGRAKAGTRVGTIGKDGTRAVMVDGTICQEAHMIWLLETGNWPRTPLYRLNGDPDDNRIGNLTQRRQEPVTPLSAWLTAP